MNVHNAEGGPIRVASAGHAAFALTMIGFGIMGLRSGDFTQIFEPVPDALPARGLLVYLCALVPLACGLGLLLRRTAAVASRVLLAGFLLWLLALRLPQMFLSFTVNFWWATCQTMVMVAASWVLHAWFAGDRDGRRLDVAGGERGIPIARAFYGLALIPIGLAHFLYLQATVDLVPGWLPAHVAWAYFTGATFIAAGVAVLIGVWARLAAALSVLQIGLFTVLVWIPIVAAGASASQWGEFVVSIALTAAGWVVADSYRGVPWLAVAWKR